MGGVIWGSSGSAVWATGAVAGTGAAVDCGPGVTLITGLAPGVGDVAGPGVAGVTLTTVLAAGALPPPVVNWAKALDAKEGVNDKMTIWRSVFM